MPDLEAVGEAVTGAALARAVEPRAGEAGNTETDGHTDERDCLNCGARLAGDYCHACGQKAHVHRTLSAFWHDLAHSVMHFDGKLWRTLPLLAWKPGELTRRYIHGERARFVSPMALFLFTVFLMFAIFSAVGIGVNSGEFGNARAGVRVGLSAEKKELAELRKARAEAVQQSDVAEVAEIDQEIRETEEGIAALNRFMSAKPGTNEADGLRTGWQRIDAGVKKLNDNPALALYKLQTNAYKFSWALIPISVPFVWLLFLHRRRYRREFGAYDHTVFVTYSIAAMSIVLIVAVLLAMVPGTGLLRGALLLLPPVHMYRQLRGAYDLSGWSAAWRTAALVILAFLSITLFLLLLAALGVVG